MSMFKTMKEWLKDVDVDQNVNGIETLDDTPRNQPGRKWFPSQEIQPVIHIGKYNRSTGRFEFSPIPGYREDAVSSAATSWTVPAGQYWRCYSAIADNANRVFILTVTLVRARTPLVTETIYSTGTGTITAMRRHDWLANKLTPSSFSGMGIDLYLEPGDVLTVTDGSYVAADVTFRNLSYEVI